MIDMDFTGRTAIVTGANRGIGRAVAERLNGLGADLFLTATSLEHFSDSQLPNSRRIALDLTDDTSVEGFLQIVLQEPVDILINNAGIHAFSPVGDLDRQVLDRLYRVNLWGAIILSDAVAVGMKRQNYGRILNVSSIAAQVSKPASSMYSATKSGLLGFTRACALDLAPYNILVNAVCPGTTQTDMVETLLTPDQKQKIIGSVPLGRLAVPEEIAELVVFMCSDCNTYMSGQAVTIDGGYTIQ